MTVCRRLVIVGLVVAAGFWPCLTAAESPPAAYRLLDPSLTTHPAWSQDNVPLPVVVALKGETAFDLWQQRSAASSWSTSSEQRARLRETAFAQRAAAQAPLQVAIEAMGARIISTYDAAMNGFLVWASRSQVLAIAALSGVERVYRAPEHVPALANAVPLVGGQAAMQELHLTGKDVTIAIVDTGIDYTHLSLGGSGRPRDFQSNNPRTVEARTFPTEKVIGGYDFAGTYYTGGNMPTADADPLDENGHGTHVAGIAAGMTGNPKVFHGMAPEAKLIALKIFGARGGTNLVIDAVEWAIEANMGRRVKGICQMPDGGDCRVDVLNMSLGAAFASDVMEQQGVMRRALEAGIVVIAAAGNDEDVPFITGAPAASDVVVSVANTYPSGLKADVVQVGYDGSTENLEALEADRSLARPIAELGELRAPVAWFGRGCSGDTPASDVAGKIALIPRGDCSFRDKLAAAEANGAVGALIYNNEAGILVMGASPPNPVGIPAYSISLQDGERIRSLVQAGTEVSCRMAASLNKTLERSSLTDVISPSSSRGPSRVGILKPNLSAPGTQIVAPYMGRGDEGVALTGTSMSSPLVAGAAALLVQRLRQDGLAPVGRPLSDRTLLTARDVGAILMNTAHATVWLRDNREGVPVPLARQGAGRVDALAAVRTNTIARAGAIAELNLGFLAVPQEWSGQAGLVIRNLSKATKRYALAIQFATREEADAGVTYEVQPESLTLGPGQEGQASVEVHVEASELRPYAGYGGAQCMSVSALSNAEVDGFVTATEVDEVGQVVAGGDSVRLPIYFVPRPASDLQLLPDPVYVSPALGQAQLKIENGGEAPGVATLFVATATDPVEHNVDRRINVDLVAVRRAKDSRGQAVLEFLVHSAGPTGVPLDSQTHIFVDTNRDGELDHAIYTQIARSGQQYVVFSATSPVQRQQPITLQRTVALDYYANVDLQSRILGLPVRASRLGLPAEGPIHLQAIVLRRAQFSDVVGGRGYVAYDFVPDNGLVAGSEGQLSAGEGRLDLDETAVAYALSASEAAVDAGGAAVISLVTHKPLPQEGEQLLVAYPQNAPGTGDIQLVRIVPGEPPTPTMVPPTATSVAPPTAEPTATARATTPTLVGRLCLPALLLSFGRQ